VLVAINHEEREGHEDRMANELGAACYGIAREKIKHWMQSSIFIRALRVLRGAILRLF
jgi:hypothetical protein